MINIYVSKFWQVTHKKIILLGQSIHWNPQWVHQTYWTTNEHKHIFCLCPWDYAKNLILKHVLLHKYLLPSTTMHCSSCYFSNSLVLMWYSHESMKNENELLFAVILFFFFVVFLECWNYYHILFIFKTYSLLFYLKFRIALDCKIFHVTSKIINQLHSLNFFGKKIDVPNAEWIFCLSC